MQYKGHSIIMSLGPTVLLNRISHAYSHYLITLGPLKNVSFANTR